MTLLAVTSGALVGCGAVGLVVRPHRSLARRVRPYTTAVRVELGHAVDVVAAIRGLTTARVGIATRYVQPLVALVARLDRASGKEDDDQLCLRLRRAGLRATTPDAYRLRVLAELIGSGATGALIGTVVGGGAPGALAVGGCGAVYGASRSRARVDRRIAARRERIRLELATVNQLLAMHLRTGAGPVQAVQRIVDRGRGVVVDELDAVLGVIRSGVPEAEAFHRAADVTPEPHAARTYRLFAAGAERGVDLADALRALSDDLCDLRREEIRKTATRRRAAALVPTIAILAPVMLLFVAAPLPSIVLGDR